MYKNKYLLDYSSYITTNKTTNKITNKTTNKTTNKENFQNINCNNERRTATTIILTNRDCFIDSDGIAVIPPQIVSIGGIIRRDNGGQSQKIGASFPAYRSGQNHLYLGYNMALVHKGQFAPKPFLYNPLWQLLGYCGR